MDTVGHFGGELTLLDGEVKVAFVRAHHGSGVAADDRLGLRHGGAPGGFVITIRGGPNDLSHRRHGLVLRHGAAVRVFTVSMSCLFASATISRWDPLVPQKQ